jgi:hypothetical protein
VLRGRQSEVGGFDPQRGVVGHDLGRRSLLATERGSDDPVVRRARIEPVLHQEMALDAVDLDLERASARVVDASRRCRQRAARRDPQLLERPQRGARRPADVVPSTLEAVELLDDGQRDDQVGTWIGGEAPRVGDQHRRVEHETQAGLLVLTSVLVSFRRWGRGGDEVGHRSPDLAGSVDVKSYPFACDGWWMEARTEDSRRST